MQSKARHGRAGAAVHHQDSVNRDWTSPEAPSVAELLLERFRQIHGNARGSWMFAQLIAAHPELRT